MLTSRTSVMSALCALELLLAAPTSAASDVCEGFGPQAPRDITSSAGSNTAAFPLAPPAASMNLCNIHTHTHAEHKGPDFAIFAGDGEHGGYKCNASGTLTASELEDPTQGHGAFHGVKPGDTIEVHWVFTTCDVKPGPTLDACSSAACANPTLRVEAQVFLVVNDGEAPSFVDYAYGGQVVNGLHQPKTLPTNTGEPVVFRGSTTGPKYTEVACSPMQVTWSVRPRCSRLSFSSLMDWAAKGNVFKEDHSHGVRPLVTAPELLSPIE